MEGFILILFLCIGLSGFFVMKKLDIFIEKNESYIDNTKRANLIHLGFDAPYLAEDFVLKVHEKDKNHHSMEMVIYTGTEKEMMNMLLTGKLDYAILTHTITDWDTNKGECIELLLQPKSLKTNGSDIHIEAMRAQTIKVNVFWIPRWIEKGKKYFSDLLTEQL